MGFWRADSDSVLTYTDELVKRARISGSPEHYLRAYHLKALTTLGSASEIYTDSLYRLADSMEDSKYLATAYFLKGRNAYDAGDYKKSLDSYLKSHELLQREVDSIRLEYLVRDNIGLIRILVGDNEGGIPIFEELLDYYKARNAEGDYLFTLFSLAVGHHQNGDYSTSQQLVHEGLGLSEGMEGGPRPYFLSVYGANQYGMGDYQTAIVNLQKANSFFKTQEDVMRQAIAHFYLGKSYGALNQMDSTLFHMQRVDALYQEHPKSLYPLTRGAWEYLLDVARKAGDTKKELEHISTLLTIDSVTSSNFRYINQNLTEKYDMPRLVREREALLSSYRNRNQKYLYGMVGLVLMTIVLAYFFIRRRGHSQSGAVTPDGSNKGNGTTLAVSPSLLLTQDKLNTISDGLVELEANQFYLEAGITVKEVAKLMGVNQKYLSHYLNRHVDMSYTEYINGLRVDHFLKKLCSDSEFVKRYTLDAMAQQCGFKSNKSLSKVCKRRLGKTASQLVRENQGPHS
ncbi:MULTISPECIES: helix-turn-helix domain-containing protein [unclassified Croceitalea]|uniref:helix-turn-helix domain-containing protein n=1 Tax=unclassified Croceitalea TaxID=2632280 RepID=UPI0030DDDB14